ncbi:hypothetical protein C2S52_001795 [Perilla frutescens var. hirtella]|nr:hypothetical protein C2S51_006772 [Perilla frutescens var. frutescens]KAH6801331.1 hypothetical protein C2S52_001795 [Perilla frutescens var. hirtella]
MVDEFPQPPDSEFLVQSLLSTPPSVESHKDVSSPSDPVLRRSTHPSHPPSYLKDYVCNSASVLEISDPSLSCTPHTFPHYISPVFTPQYTAFLLNVQIAKEPATYSEACTKAGAKKRKYKKISKKKVSTSIHEIRLELKTKNKETSSPMETKLMILARRRGRYYNEFSANFPNQVCWQEERFAQFLGSNGVNDLLNTADTCAYCIKSVVSNVCNQFVVNTYSSKI